MPIPSNHMDRSELKAKRRYIYISPAVAILDSLKLDVVGFLTCVCICMK